MGDMWGVFVDICAFPQSTRWLCLLGGLLLGLSTATVQGEYTSRTAYSHMYSAIVNITYTDPGTGEMKSLEEDSGRYGSESRKDSEWGWVVHVRTVENKTDGCSEIVNVPTTRWIALIKRGGCKFNQKINNAAVDKNASAVVIYNDKIESELLMMEHNVLDVVAIFISQPDGLEIASLVDRGVGVLMHISVGSKQPSHNDSINKTSVLFVTISFIVLMIISLAWLVFYYIQRFRYAHAKERLSKRLMNAAKKAITKMPVRTLKNGDKEVENDYDQCAVCIENYRASDVVRILPCKHMFHKSCVDPWLIEQRSCPMCKLDILKAYGLQIHGSSCDSIVNLDMEGASTSMGPTDLVSSTNRADHVEIIRFPPSAPAPAAVVPLAAPSSSSSTSSQVPPSSSESMDNSKNEELQSLVPKASLHKSSSTASTLSQTSAGSAASRGGGCGGGAGSNAGQTTSSSPCVKCKTVVDSAPAAETERQALMSGTHHDDEHTDEHTDDHTDHAADTGVN